jgi:tubby-related protein 1
LNFLSAKNFILCQDSSDPKVRDEPIMQFGKTQKSTYSLDYKYPLNALQAFGICLSTFCWEAV